MADDKKRNEDVEVEGHLDKAAAGVEERALEPGDKFEVSKKPALNDEPEVEGHMKFAQPEKVYKKN